MEIIQLKEVWKIYNIKQHRTGFWGGMKDLFSPVYVTKEAVRGINLSIAKGEAVGYIGPNGSGKSTTIKMLTGILSPTQGTVKVNGLEPSKHRKENAAKIGVVFGQKSQLWWDLNIKETFELFRHIYRIPKGVFTTNLEVR
ncbi:ATP-binding cassette domain-containing protein [Cohnella algarum]|uniref:ATP-binding cassette domain-containing protein n=1 Tax=Cohnella algarum TaxID=2044859 RepID=UPI0019677363|nr:ATP-binding cassette domain-containing protein [Cohnella algarum]MBN2984749.1 ATP-binding cassette domain-containing protein [Cohnella algarum]